MFLGKVYCILLQINVYIKHPKQRECFHATIYGLRRWGDRKQFHLDAWGAVKSADGYAISLKRTPATHAEKLYFVNLGGYDPHQFTELHKNVLVVAQSDKEAKAKAKTTAKAQIQNWVTPHRDNLFEIEKMLELTQIE